MPRPRSALRSGGSVHHLPTAIHTETPLLAANGARDVQADDLADERESTGAGPGPVWISYRRVVSVYVDGWATVYDDIVIVR